MAEEDQIKIKDYQIHLPPLGEGAYGKVYRATYRGISDRALKIFRPGAVDIATMARELEKLSQVTEHQGIVTLHDFDLLHAPPYYAMGLHADQSPEGTWETRTLERLCGHVDDREGWRLIREMAEALSYLHRHHIIHCDVKPSNILLTNDTPYHIKICDFGQSRGLAAEEFQPVGTPLYASPEQLRNPRDSAEGKGFRWDVYSFGVVAFKLLTGELPRLQALAEAERQSFDPESTLVEASLEATVAETGKPVDGEQLATMTEAVEELNWPSDVYVPTDRKELIEQCLNLDPSERPADMREVTNRMQRLDQQRVVKRARRLNTIFATLLVVAIWASGFAFVQAQRAKRATEAAMIASAESEKSAGAAVDLMLLFVSELNRGDISGAGADRLYSIVAEHAATFLENRSKDRRTSTRILTFSAQTASLRGRQNLSEGDLEEALKDFTSAYEIRSKLADDPNSTDELAIRASYDLMEIGKIHELNNDYEEAAEVYSDALEWRSQAGGEEGIFSLRQIRELAETYRALGRVYYLQGEIKLGVSTLDEIINILNSRIEDSRPSQVPGYAIEAVRTLNLKGYFEYQSENLADASTTFEELTVLAKSLEDGPSEISAEARAMYLTAINKLGRIQLAQEQPEAALVLFREEIRAREDNPYDIQGRVALAEAYALASKCLDLDDPTSRSLAVYYLEHAVSLITKLPENIRNQEDTQAKVLAYNDALSAILEMQE
ncbi:MAG: protein kinase [Verrucomicrobiales bacterium]